jgi:hypothetical protein
MSTVPSNGRFAKERRWLWLTGGAVIAASVWLVPYLILTPGPQPMVLSLIQVAVCGLVLGLGRQGIDVLVMRLLFATLGVSFGLLISESAHGQALCSGAQGCFQYLVLLFGFGGLVLAILMAFVGVPTTVVWRRGLTGLGPELTWPLPSAAWQWAVFIAGAVFGVYAFVYLMGFPWPA